MLGFYLSYISLTITELSTDPRAGPVVRLGYTYVEGDQKFSDERGHI
jgi:hypothetical protein